MNELEPEQMPTQTQTEIQLPAGVQPPPDLSTAVPPQIKPRFEPPAPVRRSWVAVTRPWPEPVDGGLLLDELSQLLARFVVLPPHAADTLALWIVHSYAFEFRDVTAYLGIESPEKRCGKTTLLSVLNELVSRPIAAANVSAPAFFRVIEEARPTLLIDEADTFLEGNDGLRGILNSGYTRNTAFVMRVGFQDSKETMASATNTGGSLCINVATTSDASGGSSASRMRPCLEEETKSGAASRLARYSCWCPKVMATIGRLPETLADRCIVIRMQRKSKFERCERVRDIDRAAAARLRQQCLRFAYDHAEAITAAKPAVPAELNDRAADIWEPLLALADLAGGEWPERSRRAAENLGGCGELHGPTASLLADLLIHFTEFENPATFSREVVGYLNRQIQENQSRPWMALRTKKEIDELWLSRQLAPYGLRPRTVRFGGTTAKGYVKEDFTEVFRRYVPKSAVDEVFQRPVEEGEEPMPEASRPITDEPTERGCVEDQPQPCQK